MNLFIDTVSKKSTMILFDEKRDITAEESFEINWNESSLLIPNIDNFLKKNNVSYFDLKNIVLVNWPGSFTGLRTSVLAVNSINFVIKQNLTGINYFEMFNDYPIVKKSSRKDSFVKLSKNADIDIVDNSKIEDFLKSENIKTVYWDLELQDIQTIENIDYSSIIQNIELQKNKKLEAMYIKKPNIS